MYSFLKRPKGGGGGGEEEALQLEISEPPLLSPRHFLKKRK